MTRFVTKATPIVYIDSKCHTKRPWFKNIAVLEVYQYGRGTDIGISVILVSVKISYVWSPDNISIGISTNIHM